MISTKNAIVRCTHYDVLHLGPDEGGATFIAGMREFATSLVRAVALGPSGWTDPGWERTKWVTRYVRLDRFTVPAS